MVKTAEVEEVEEKVDRDFPLIRLRGSVSTDISKAADADKIMVVNCHCAHTYVSG